MAKICIVREREADFIAFRADRESKADLLVFQTDKENKAVGDKIWYFEKNPKKASSKIAWTDKERDADFKVFFVDRESKAKWQKPNNAQNRL